MSDSVRPHRWQPTRLPHSWDSLGNNTGMDCHFLLQCMKVKSESEVTQSYPTLSDPMDCSLPGSSIHGIFQARVLEWGAIAFSEDTITSDYIKSTKTLKKFFPWRYLYICTFVSGNSVCGFAWRIQLNYSGKQLQYSCSRNKQQQEWLL